MRYDKQIYFQRRVDGAYDPASGSYADDVLVETMRLANVTDTSTQTLKLVYGNIRQGSKVVRLQNGFTEAFDTIRIDGKVYKIDYSKSLFTRATFVVSEVQNG